MSVTLFKGRKVPIVDKVNTALARRSNLCFEASNLNKRRSECFGIDCNCCLLDRLAPINLFEEWEADQLKLAKEVKQC